MNWLVLGISGCLLVATPSAIACQCCAEDDHSDVRDVSSDSYPDSVLKSVKFGSGSIRDSGYEIGWDVSGITRSGDEFTIHADVGDLLFKVRGMPEQRSADITFITKPAGNLNHMNDVYHEIQLDGLLTLSPEAAKQFGQPSVIATLLLQGRGSACLEVGSYQRWLFRARSKRELLHGVGTLIDAAS
jgi:hypothetical protein